MTVPTSPIDRARLCRTFFEEAAEHVATLETSLIDLERAPGDAELLGRLFRAAHSIKGGAGIVGLTELARFTHLVESLLDRMRQGQLEPTAAHIDLLLRATDEIGATVTAASAGQPTAWPAALGTDLVVAIGGAAPPAGSSAAPGTARAAAPAPDAPASLAVPAPPPSGPPAPSLPAPSAGQRYRVQFVPAHDALQSGCEPVALLAELARVAVIEHVDLDLSGLPALAALDPRTSHVGWQLVVRTELDAEAIRAMFAPAAAGATIDVAPEAAATAVSPAARAPRASDGGSIRVSIAKADTLVNLTGELVIHQAMVSDLVRNFRADRLPQLVRAVAEMERNTRELQERVLAIRMVPIGVILSRVPRIVRGVAASLGKQVEIELSGEDAELDKSMVEQLADPLTHLVRNAIDHGIEAPEARRAAGKPPHGTLQIAAAHQGGSFTLEIRDDGRGLDTAKIRARAAAAGLIEAHDELSDAAIYALILRPGFSTAETVTDVSGRGVGLDVVKRNIEALSGSLQITSTPGAGACFRITLPLTLAILDGMSLRIGESAFVLPLASIVESIRVRPGQLKRMLGRGELIDLRGESLPLVRLHRLFHIEGAVEDPTRGLVVIVEHGGRKVGLLVDEITGQPQVVIKSLERHYRKVDGLMGATILGDGHVTLILDVPSLIRKVHAAAGPPAQGALHAS